MDIHSLGEVKVSDDHQTSEIIGAAIEVHRLLGHGFLEAVYHNALCQELLLRSIPFQREVTVPVYYKGTKLTCGYRADVLCYEQVLVELKAQSRLTPIDEAQVINYLRATEFERALLLNFGAARLEVKRLVLTAEYRKT